MGKWCRCRSGMEEGGVDRGKGAEGVINIYHRSRNYCSRSQSRMPHNHCMFCLYRYFFPRRIPILFHCVQAFSLLFSFLVVSLYVASLPLSPFLMIKLLISLILSNRCPSLVISLSGVAVWLSRESDPPPYLTSN